MEIYLLYIYKSICIFISISYCQQDDFKLWLWAIQIHGESKSPSLWSHGMTFMKLGVPPWLRKPQYIIQMVGILQPRFFFSENHGHSQQSWRDPGNWTLNKFQESNMINNGGTQLKYITNELYKQKITKASKSQESIIILGPKWRDKDKHLVPQRVEFAPTVARCNTLRKLPNISKFLQPWKRMIPQYRDHHLSLR